MTSLRALLIGGLAATALVLPAGTALAGDDGIDRSGPPEAGAPCSPEVDTEYGYDAEGTNSPVSTACGPRCSRRPRPTRRRWRRTPPPPRAETR